MKSKRVLLGLIIVLAAILAAGLRTAQKATVESSQRAFLVAAERQLGAYHDRHGRYPESLDDLSLGTDLFDGRPSSALPPVSYRTDGDYFRLSTRSAWDGSELSVCR